MGVVYKAEDTKLRRTVALKFLPRQALGDEEEKARFIREAQAAAALDHPNICTIHEINEIDDTSFITMAYVDGPNLKEEIESKGTRAATRTLAQISKEDEPFFIWLRRLDALKAVLQERTTIFFDSEIELFKDFVEPPTELSAELPIELPREAPDRE